MWTNQMFNQIIFGRPILSKICSNFNSNINEISKCYLKEEATLPFSTVRVVDLKERTKLPGEKEEKIDDKKKEKREEKVDDGIKRNGDESYFYIELIVGVIIFFCAVGFVGLLCSAFKKYRMYIYKKRGAQYFKV